MSNAIPVTPQFLADWKELCGYVGLEGREEQEMRAVVRADFEVGRHWVELGLWVHRYCRQKWGRLPTVDECRLVLGDAADPAWFEREGILVLAGRCAGAEKFPA